MTLFETTIFIIKGNQVVGLNKSRNRLLRGFGENERLNKTR